MLDYFAAIAAVSVVLSIFMLTVTLRATRRAGVRILKYLAASFILIFLTNLLVILNLFYPASFGILIIPGFIVADLLIKAAFGSGQIYIATAKSGIYAFRSKSGSSGSKKLEPISDEPLPGDVRRELLKLGFTL